MPKLGNIADQSKIKFSDLVLNCNMQDQDSLPTLEGTSQLGKEWKYYNRILDKQRRAKQNEEERLQKIKDREKGGSQF